VELVGTSNAYYPRQLILVPFEKGSRCTGGRSRSRRLKVAQRSANSWCPAERTLVLASYSQIHLFSFSTIKTLGHLVACSQLHGRADVGVAGSQRFPILSDLGSSELGTQYGVRILIIFDAGRAGRAGLSLKMRGFLLIWLLMDYGPRTGV
jgi:hypothetical protein